LKTNSVSIWLVIPSLVFVFLLGLPVVAILWQGLELSLPTLLNDPQASQALTLSLVTSTTATLVAIVLGAPLAYILARTRFAGRSLAELVVDLPIVLPPSVAGLALLLAFGRRGLLGESLGLAGIQLPFTTMAVVLAQLFVAGPFFVRTARVGFAAVEHQLEEAAFSEGASPWQMFRYVMVPVTLPALVSGALLCWARALGEFGATLLFAGNLVGRTQTMPLAIYVGLESNREVAVALSVVLLFVSAGLLALLRRFERSWQAR
jgi:molybdate transport system permease protein